MNNQKKSKNTLKGILADRKFRYGGYAAALTAIVIAVVILLNVALGAVEDNWALAIDVTALGATDFDEQTYQVVDDIDETVYVYTMFQDSTTHTVRIQAEEVLNKYRALNNNIVVTNVDPVKNPAFVEKYAGDTRPNEGSLVVTNADESRIKLIDLTAYYHQYPNQYDGQTYTMFSLEPNMTSALLFVTSDVTPRIFFLDGHGELAANQYCTALLQQLKGQNFEVAMLNLTTNTDVTLEKGDTLAIINPVRDLSDAEYEILKKWLADGGKMLFVLDYTTDQSVLKNFKALLDYYQLSFGDGVIAESVASINNWNGNYYNLIPNLNTENEITASLIEKNQQYLLLPQARPVNSVAMPEANVIYDNLLTTSASAVVESANGTGMPGTQIIALAMEQADAADASNNVRIVLMGSFYSLADTNLINASYNMNYSINMFNWLADRDTVVEIGAKMISNNAMVVPDAATAYTLGAVVVITVPLMVLIAGVLVWLKRRSL